MLYDYTYKKPLDELSFYYVINPGSPYKQWALHEVIRPAFRALSAEYGISFTQLQYNELPPHPAPHMLSYVLYGPTNPLTIQPSEKEYLARLATLGCKVNIMSAYPLTATGQDRADYARATTLVPKLCHELHINAIFPDDIHTKVGIRSIDWQDLRDNVIGETIRVKYRVTRSEHPEDLQLLDDLHARHASDITRLAELHAKHHLWQRAPTDGSILFTHDGYWYSSQTKTNKATMTPQDYSLVTSYDEGERAVTYVGRKLPSSDAPEYLLMSTLMSMRGKRPKLFVHFHHLGLTRGQRYRDLVTSQKIEYGQFISGRYLMRELHQKSADWLIILEHGALWTGDSVDEFEAFLHAIEISKQTA